VQIIKLQIKKIKMTNYNAVYNCCVYKYEMKFVRSVQYLVLKSLDILALTPTLCLYLQFYCTYLCFYICNFS